jgi:hypothetical protein
MLENWNWLRVNAFRHAARTRPPRTRRRCRHDRLVSADAWGGRKYDTETRIGKPKRRYWTQVRHRVQTAPTSDYMLMMSYISPLATACCTVATPSLRLAFSV